MKTFVWLCLAISLMTSCASPYHSIKPALAGYGNSETTDGITFSYKYEVLRATGNGKYAKHENKKGFKVVAVRIVNKSDKSLVFGNNAKLYSGTYELRLVDPKNSKRKLRQSVFIYLLYLGFTPATLSTGSTDPTTGARDKNGDIPFGLFLGPLAAFFDMGLAATANHQFLKELTESNMIGRVIDPGQTASGFVTVAESGYNPVKLVIKN